MLAVLHTNLLCAPYNPVQANEWHQATFEQHDTKQDPEVHSKTSPSALLQKSQVDLARAVHVDSTMDKRNGLRGQIVITKPELLTCLPVVGVVPCLHVGSLVEYSCADMVTHVFGFQPSACEDWHVQPGSPANSTCVLQ